MKTLLALTLLVSSSAMAAELTKSPWKYAVEDSKVYAEGDTNSQRGWKGCAYAEGSSAESLKIECSGARTILMFGGHAVTNAFSCAYEFGLVSRAKGYRVLAAECM